MKKKIDFVFIILAYANTEDIKFFFESLKCIIGTYRTVVVDSYYSVECSNKLKAVAEKNNAIFLSIPNKGYSYGNNRGIDIANKLYDYEYIVIANPDIEIKKLSIDTLAGYNKCVIGPCIMNRDGKYQNPMYIKKNLGLQKIIYQGLKTDCKLLMFLGIGLNKLQKKILVKKRKSFQKVYQIHGSCMILPKYVVKKLGQVFDENIFLFAEESYLANILAEQGIDSYISNNIQVFHKEDGSMHYRDDINIRLKEANIYVFQKYYKFK